MSTVKLTLSAEAEIVKLAKRLAKLHKSSVSAMFARFISASAMCNREIDETTSSPITSSAIGLIPSARGKTSRQVLESALTEKYGQ